MKLDYLMIQLVSLAIGKSNVQRPHKYKGLPDKGLSDNCLTYDNNYTFIIPLTFKTFTKYKKHL